MHISFKRCAVSPRIWALHLSRTSVTLRENVFGSLQQCLKDSSNRHDVGITPNTKPLDTQYEVKIVDAPAPLSNFTERCTYRDHFS